MAVKSHFLRLFKQYFATKNEQKQKNEKFGLTFQLHIKDKTAI